MNHRRAVTAAEFGQAIRWAREERGLQQADLADRLSVARMTVSRLERGGPVSAATAVRALSECGFEVVVMPKFSRITVEDGLA